MCTAVPESLMSLGFEGFFLNIYLGVCMCVTAHAEVRRQHVYTGMEHKLLGLAGNTFSLASHLPNPCYNLYESVCARACVCYVCTPRV